MKDGKAVGFTQLYPSFSSGALARIFVLNDLFVDPCARHIGAGSALLQAAAEYGRRVGALRLVLSTEVTNTPAQSLYEKLGRIEPTRSRRFTNHSRGCASSGTIQTEPSSSRPA